MSLGIAIKAPEGIVLAAESRVTLVVNTPEGPLPVHFDNATKLFGFEEPNNYVGVVTYGLAAIGQRTAHSFLPELESALHAEGKGRLTVAAMAQRISDFYMAQWQAVIPGPHGGPPMTLLVAGYDLNEPYGEVYQIDIPTLPAPVQHHPGQNFGVTWGGQREFVDRLFQGYDAQLLNILAAQGLQSNQIEALRQAFQPLQMRLPLKWSDDWLANVDCNGDHKLDRGLNAKTGVSTGTSLGWVTNHFEGDYLGSDGDLHHYEYFAKIMYDGGAACAAGSTSCIWGSYTIIEELQNDQFGEYGGRLKFINKLTGPGLGK
jgi:hypothetical protein